MWLALTGNLPLTRHCCGGTDEAGCEWRDEPVKECDIDGYPAIEHMECCDTWLCEDCLWQHDDHAHEPASGGIATPAAASKLDVSSVMTTYRKRYRSHLLQDTVVRIMYYGLIAVMVAFAIGLLYQHGV